METGIILRKPMPNQPPVWEPQVGNFSKAYREGLEGIDNKSLDRVFAESSQILGNCSAPWTKEYSESGLVIGYVQSGKTLSFTTIAALARDNGYGIVIVLAGVNNLLKDQSTDRLVDDLGLKRFAREWRIFENPGATNLSASNLELQDMREAVAGWKRWLATGGMKKPSILITVLKHSGRLKALANALRLMDLADVPVLIVDDESDQATPNTKSASNAAAGLDEASATYAAVQDVRAQLTRHSYLQYTATPQANLLAAKVDQLSPRFARVISSGDAYLGGEFFFGNPKSLNLITIPDEDIFKKNSYPDEAPPSLLEALRLFWLGASHTVLTGDDTSVRSMMIQASQLTEPHRTYAMWAQSAKGMWASILRNPDTESYRLLVEEFELSFENFTSTVQTDFSMIDYISILSDVIDETNVVLVNSNEDAVAKIDWYKAQFWILVGGMKLDRGFTVKGIISTYMPRTAAENADVLQQRARFFGYHGDYAGLVRVFLGKATHNAFVSYLEHETFLRESLIAHQGQPLSEWKRDFVLNRAIKRPVRSSVVGRNLSKVRLNDSWLAPAHMHERPDLVQMNNTWLSQVESTLREQGVSEDGSQYPGWKDLRSGPKHRVFRGIPARKVQEILLGFSFGAPRDESKFLALEIAISLRLSQNPNLTFNIVFMNDLSLDGQTGRNVDETKGLTNIFIGRNPASAESYEELNYVGDLAIRDPQIPTLHLRRIRVNTVEQQEPINVAWVAVNLTEKLESDFYTEVE